MIGEVTRYISESLTERFAGRLLNARDRYARGRSVYGYVDAA